MPERRPVWTQDAVAARNIASSIVRQCGFLLKQAPDGGPNAIRSLVIAMYFERLAKVVARMERRYRRERKALEETRG